MRKYFWVFVIFITLAATVTVGVFFMSGVLRSVRILQLSGNPAVLPDALNALPASSTAPVSVAVPPEKPKNQDAEPSVPLSNPPAIVKAVYATSWSAGSKAKSDYLINLINETELNAVVIDIKDYSGYLAYRTDLELPKRYEAVELRIPKLNVLLGRLHGEGIYAIARISVFQDGRLASARPDLAITSSSTGAVWTDRKGLAWVDPASHEVWEYNAAVAREAFNRGFDEVNFDYIRFPSDGDMRNLSYPAWDGQARASVLGAFWTYLRSEFPGKQISADLFGLTTVDFGDLGIGQRFQFALPHFDHIAPMVYPSHYASGVFGFANPAEHPYEIVKRSLEGAVGQIKAYQAAHASTTSPAASSEIPTAKLRPWLQDFNLGATYTAEMVHDQIRAVAEVASSSPELVSGWMLWNPANVYTKGALAPDER